MATIAQHPCCLPPFDALLPRRTAEWVFRAPQLWTAGLTRPWRHFERAAAQPRMAQDALMRRLLSDNARTAYGRAHGFGSIDSVAAYQAKVPIVDYETLKPWIADIIDGKSQVLTQQPVLALRHTAGHAGSRKVLPVTAGLQAQIGAALQPWLHNLLRHQPELWRRRIYWEIPRQASGTTHDAVPWAQADPTAYLAGWAARVMRRHLAVPAAVGALETAQQWRRATLYHLLLASDLAGMVLGNPATALDLMQLIEADLADLLEMLPDARADQIRAALDRDGKLSVAALWPRLQLVVMWQDGAAAALSQAAAACFPGVAIRTSPIATQECILTSPRWEQRQGDPLAITSHFFEFMDVDAPRRRPLLAAELQVGGVYIPIVSTAGGLYRYRLQDAVSCQGHQGATPLLKYVDRAEPTTNLHGERLTPQRLQRALTAAARQLSMDYRFALGAPLPQASGYCLYVECDAPEATLRQFGQQVEAALCRDYAYEYGRQQGHLQALQVRRVQHGWRNYQRTLHEFDVPPGEIKPTSLDPRAVWPMVF